MQCIDPGADWYLASELSSVSGDCLATNDTVYPGATEICDGLDNDCDGTIDEGVTNTYYQDSDSDNYGNVSVTTGACSAPVGFTGDATDCLDTNNTVYPGATEICDELDNDCDSTIDEGVQNTYYQDSDSDGQGNVSVTTGACSAPVGFTGNATDCNDAVNTIYSGAAEVTGDNVDQSCDGSEVCYIDADNDGYRLTTTNTSVDADCNDSGEALASDPTLDCLDTNDTVYPGAAEICDELDNDCDASIDEGVQTTYYQDSDADNYGNVSVTTGACSAPVGYTGDATDCSDTNNTVYPGAAEICDGLDNDCDSTVDEGVTNTFYQDSDDDTYGNAAVTTGGA